MAKDNNIFLINEAIPKAFIPTPPKQGELYCVSFSEYQKIYTLLKTNSPSTIHIYDYTHVPTQKPGHLFFINDHINRIGENPFIGAQNHFNIDFINTEFLYAQKENGIITCSCGSHQPHGQHPSSYIANVVVLAHILKYQIEGFLINME